MNIKNENGITLLALVVTIVVMVILASITITASVGENGLIKQVETGTIKASIREVEEALDAYMLLKEKDKIKNGDFTGVDIEDLTEIVGPTIEEIEDYYKIYTITADGLKKINVKGDLGKGTSTDVFKIKEDQTSMEYEVFYITKSGKEITNNE